MKNVHTVPHAPLVHRLEQCPLFEALIRQYIPFLAKYARFFFFPVAPPVALAVYTHQPARNHSRMSRLLTGAGMALS
jgi:hypothetical protein